MCLGLVSDLAGTKRQLHADFFGNGNPCSYLDFSKPQYATDNFNCSPHVGAFVQ